MRLNHLKHFVVQVTALYQGRKELFTLNASRIKPVLKRLHHNHYYTTVGTPRTAIHRPAKASSPLAVSL
jgi:hypothetical protein